MWRCFLEAVTIPSRVARCVVAWNIASSGVSCGHDSSSRSLVKPDPKGPDAILASTKKHILSDVAAIVNSRKFRADMKVHLSQKAMLGIVGAYAHSARISVLNFNTEIADCGIERTRVR